MLTLLACEGSDSERIPIKDPRVETDSILKDGKVVFTDSIEIRDEQKQSENVSIFRTISPDGQANEVQLLVHVGKIEEGPIPQKVKVEALLVDGRVVSYSIKVAAEVMPAKDTTEAVYIIKKNDTKTGLAKQFGIPITSIKNRELIIGQKLIIQ